MKLAEYRAARADQPKPANPHVQCNALYKTDRNINCYLTASQAIELARNLLSKAQVILDNGIEDAVVHVWNQGVATERIYCGMTKARVGERRPKPKQSDTGDAQ